MLGEATSALAGVKDQASAQSARPALIAIAKRLREPYDKAMTAMSNDPGAMQRAFDEALAESLRNPEKARAEAERHEKELLPVKLAMDDLITEAARVTNVPGGKELLDAFWDAWGEEGKLVKLGVGMSQMAKGVTNEATKGNIGSVRIGMTEHEVIDIMGKPFNIDTNRPGLRVLSYITGAVDIKDGKVVKKFP